ncbi:hypothetical protein BCR44DRAFT_1152465 [Catenaria anguillulae PL171]|uniref:Uncharacterized protein n=1 Tax=Catenaria anguillulae PL171 TaxID=765915 RepID=A0A1Y2H3U1_9FUNG|nr:hypothetical protein BCR44DRAFT_1152465 [Catenaria anguillulae PL171]
MVRRIIQQEGGLMIAHDGFSSDLSEESQRLSHRFPPSVSRYLAVRARLIPRPIHILCFIRIHPPSHDQLARSYTSNPSAPLTPLQDLHATRSQASRRIHLRLLLPSSRHDIAASPDATKVFVSPLGIPIPPRPRRCPSIYRHQGSAASIAASPLTC